MKKQKQTFAVGTFTHLAYTVDNSRLGKKLIGPQLPKANGVFGAKPLAIAELLQFSSQNKLILCMF